MTTALAGGFFLKEKKLNTMSKNLLKRLDKGPVICAEGFLFEIEKRGN